MVPLHMILLILAFTIASRKNRHYPGYRVSLYTHISNEINESAADIVSNSNLVSLYFYFSLFFDFLFWAKNKTKKIKHNTTQVILETPT